MIRFINEKGETFDGTYPYVHWLEGQQSTGIWHTVKLMFISDERDMQTSILDDKSIFRFIDPASYSLSGINLDLNEISKTSIISPSDEYDGYYLHQVLLVCKSDAPGEFIETFNIGQYTVTVGVDLYGEDETLSINLSNRGTNLPVSIQKAILDNDIREDFIDYALINRKFKELVSNYMDVVDCRGSYKSLYNSLKWFEWGENTRLYEVWKGNAMFFEKELNLLLSDTFSDLLFTHKKTTHLSLVTALQNASGEFDDERNPVVENIAYKWSAGELAVKVSLLGAFFERYFMPIHLDLKRACVESLVYTNQIKAKAGTLEDTNHFHDDIGVIDVEMDRTVTLGNLLAVAVGEDTMFARKVSEDMYIKASFNNAFNISFKAVGADENNRWYLTPIGVQPIEDIDNIYWQNGDDYNNNSSGLATFYGQLKGGVGVIVPINVSLHVPLDDAINTEVITLYKEDGTILQTSEKRLFKPDDNGVVSFSFNLLSTCEEKVKFSIMLYSLSGHVWVANDGYECVDVRGGYLDICVVNNTDNITNPTFTTNEEWMANDHDGVFNPYASMFNTIVKNGGGSYTGDTLTQYLPYTDTELSQFNQLIVIENPKSDDQYDKTWVDNIKNVFWDIYRGGEDGDFDNPRYTMLIWKSPGKEFDDISEFISYITSHGVSSVSSSNVKRFEMIYIPQLHMYTSIESREPVFENFCFDKSDLLCVIPQFKKAVEWRIDRNSIIWEYKNMTTLESIKSSIPMQIPLIADSKNKSLDSGYWTIIMYYKLSGSSEVHTLTKNSAFKII